MGKNLVLGGTFDVPNHPHGEFVLGKLYTKVWRAPYTHGLTDKWRQCCVEYWERVEQRFGYVFSEPKYTWSLDPDVGPVVMTAATPIAKLKGDRVPRPRSEPETVQ